MQGHKPNRAVFLDRDGVINVDHGYVHRVDQLDFIPGIFDLARFVVGELNWPLIVATNQAGIGRGYFSDDAYQALTLWICKRFAAEGAPLSKLYYCPYHPQAAIEEYRLDHPWRKPRPGMILQAAADYDLDLPHSVLIGDSMSDIQCAAAAGIGIRIRLDPLGAAPAPDAPAHEVRRDLGEVLSYLRVCVKADV
jgi:D-glycero-D-manno-heptose 1,7-bisphosphate phosphatase